MGRKIAEEILGLKGEKLGRARAFWEKSWHPAGLANRAHFRCSGHKAAEITGVSVGDALDAR